MKEVSCKVMAQVLREAERRKLAPERLTAGTDCTIEQLRNAKERIHWNEFRQIMQNVSGVWSEKELIEVGKLITISPFVRPIILAARLLFTAKDFYHWINKGPGEGGGGLLFTNMQPHVRETGANSLEVDLLTLDGYPLCREFYLMTLGSFIVVPTLLGLPESEVTMDDRPRGVCYKIRYPSGGGVLQKAMKVVTWPFTVHAVAKQLMEANDVLEARYQEIEKARVVLARQATKLRTANEIGLTLHGDLDFSRTLSAVTRALVEEAGFARGCVDIEVEVDGIKVVRSSQHGDGGERLLERKLEGRDGRGLGKLGVYPRVNADRNEHEELLDFIVPSIAMALDNAVSHLVVEEYRRGLEVRVEERTAELSEARDALAGTVHDLEEAKEIRDRIFASINHDLRSPLSLILLSISEARRAGATAASERTLGAIEHGARRVLRMVDELLILAEGREGEVRLWTAMCDLGEMATAVADAWEPAARAAGLTLAQDIQKGLIVRADPNAIERVLANLVSNALKFTPQLTPGGARGAIHMSLVAHEGHARLEVRDNGPGIDPELRARLFGRFERGAASKHSAIGGSGLGLSLVKELTEAHGGQASVHDAPGGGALFRVDLPLVEKLDGDATPVVTAATKTALRPADFGITSLGEQVVKTYEPVGKTPRATLLLAEDDPDLRERTAQLLAEDYRVLAAPDGLSALELAKQHSPDLLITDIAMPGIDGIELTRRFRALPNGRLAPVLVLTTFGGVGDKLAGFDAGAVDYIHKPFEPIELRARVKSQLMLRALALQLLETEKLAALGTLSAGLAHEIRNPANGIINAVGPLRELLPPEALLPGSPAAQLFDIVEHCSRQVAAMSRQLLGFKRGVEPQRTPVSIATLIARVCTTVSPSLEGVELREALDYSGPIHCAEPLLAQVLTNLLQNGAHAAGRGGWVEVRTGLDHERVFVEVRDSGPGVPDELRERIFEPFFTTKPAGSGTGLGLSTARDIVLRHGGTLDARSAAGRTVFRMEIPLPS